MKLNLLTCVYLGWGCLFTQALPILSNLLCWEKNVFWGARSWKMKPPNYVVRESHSIFACQVGERKETLYVTRLEEPMKREVCHCRSYW